MFKHPKCGGKHTSVAEARTCEQGGGVATMERDLDQSDVEADGRRSAIMDSLRGQPARREAAVTAAQGVRSINAPRTGYVREATEAATKYVADLLVKRVWQGLTSQQGDQIIAKLVDSEPLTAEEASYLIEELKPMERCEDTRLAPRPAAPQAEGTARVDYQALRALKAQVPDGRYAVDLPGGDKVKFFALRTKPNSQYFTITHHVSDERYSWPTSRYAEVLEAILAAGVQVAGQRYADEYDVCYRCGRALTDTDNPYKVHGLGPDCGPKVMG